MPIIDIQRRLAETGRIRIGQTVATQNGKKRPKRLETFRLTSSNEAAIIAVAKKYGGDVRPWEDAPVGTQWELFTASTILDVLIPPEAMSFSQFYELWSGGGCKRRCNGSRQQDESACVCDPEERECKPHTRLSVMLADLPGAGLWRLDTQGWNAATELGGAFELALLISNATGRAIVPGKLRLDQREVKRPEQPTRQFVVPVLDFDVDMNALARGGYAALGNGVTPVPEFESMRSLADELEAVNHPAEKPKRANAAEPVKSTGIAPRARGIVKDEDDEETGEAPSEEQMKSLKAVWGMLDEQDLAVVTTKFGEAKLSKHTNQWTAANVTLALDIIGKVLNPQVEAETFDDFVDDLVEVDTHIVTADEILPPVASRQKITRLNILFGEGGFDTKDREAIHVYAAKVIGVPNVKSLNDLTKPQVEKIIDQLLADAESKA